MAVLIVVACRHEDKPRAPLARLVTLPRPPVSTQPASIPSPAASSPSAQCDQYRAAVGAAVRDLPDSLPRPASLAPAGLPGLKSWYHPEANLGVGVLKPDVRGGEDPPPWQCGLLVPLYHGPAQGHFGWLVGNFLARSGVTWPMPIEIPVLAIGQGKSGLIVLEARPDGWIRFRYYFPGRALGDGTAWTHISQLGFGPVHLALVRWEDFLAHGTPPLVYRDGARHALFATPDSASAPRAWIDADYDLVPLEIKGDWMRVTLEVPIGWCAPEHLPTRTEGWVLWRNRLRGPLVWVDAWDC